MRVFRPAVLLACAGIILAAAPIDAWARSGRAQSGLAADNQPDSDISRAKRALNEGRYADVPNILAAAAADDPTRAAIRALAASATGRDEDAERILRAAASRHPASDAALELGLLLRRLGRRDEARRVLAVVVSLPDSPTSEDLVRAGRAARALGRYQEANDDLREAAEGASADPAANAAWGELFFEKHNDDDAVRCFKAALQADPVSVNALIGLARATADVDVAAALASVRRALEINPSSADAYALMAAFLLDAGYKDAASESVTRALAVNPRCLEAHALAAAGAYLADRPADFERAINAALAIDRTYGEAYRVVAAQLAHHYRFDDAVALARKAVALDPENARARAELGMDLLRIGEEDEARVTLKRAFDDDPYDAVTYNLLAVLDELKDFETVREGDLVVRFDPRESKTLRAPVLALAQDALRTLSARYGFVPKGPILVEIFPHHDDFAVRNLGIPGLVGALGACFGRVVTMDSPRARPPGAFEWGATLWHELTHVFTLQMSNQRIPRWLTEGISVYEEQRARPEWRRPMEEEFVRALGRGDVPSIGDMDRGFTDPKTIALAYYHAGLIVGYIVDTYGQAKLNALVRTFADGTATSIAFERTLGAGPDRVQAGFAQSLDKSFGPLRRALEPPVAAPLERASVDELKTLAVQRPDSYAVQLALGQALRAQSDIEGATQALNRAAALFPMAMGHESPHAILADMASDRGDRITAAAEMDKQLEHDAVNIDLARRLAGSLGQEDNPAVARRAYERIVALDPFDSEAHSKLGHLALAAGDATVAVREFGAALAAGAVDAPAARCDLAEAYLLAGDAAQAKREIVAALERAPTYERAQNLLLKLVGGDR